MTRWDAALYRGRNDFFNLQGRLESVVFQQETISNVISVYIISELTTWYLKYFCGFYVLFFVCLALFIVHSGAIEGQEKLADSI